MKTENEVIQSMLDSYNEKLLILQIHEGYQQMKQLTDKSFQYVLAKTQKEIKEAQSFIKYLEAKKEKA